MLDSPQRVPTDLVVRLRVRVANIQSGTKSQFGEPQDTATFRNDWLRHTTLTWVCRARAVGDGGRQLGAPLYRHADDDDFAALSMIRTAKPRRVRSIANAVPVGPPPTTRTSISSVFDSVFIVTTGGRGLQARGTGQGEGGDAVGVALSESHTHQRTHRSSDEMERFGQIQPLGQVGDLPHEQGLIVGGVHAIGIAASVRTVGNGAESARMQLTGELIPVEQWGGQATREHDDLSAVGPGHLVMRDPVTAFDEVTAQSGTCGLVQVTGFAGHHELLHDLPFFGEFASAVKKFSSALATHSGSSSGSRWPPLG